MTEPEIPFVTLIPVDDVAWQNDMHMAEGRQVCVGYDGITRPFTIPLNVRKDWARRGQANPYTNRVEVELIDKQAMAEMERSWAEETLAEATTEGWHTMMARWIIERQDRPPLWRRALNWVGLGQP